MYCFLIFLNFVSLFSGSSLNFFKTTVLNSISDHKIPMYSVTGGFFLPFGGIFH